MATYSNTQVEQPATSTELHAAATTGNIHWINNLLDQGMDIQIKNPCGRTALHDAIDSKKLQAVELLVECGADVNARDNDGTSPLHIAAKKGCIITTEYLISHGAFVNCATWTKQYTPLHFAVEEGRQKVVTLLLAKGARVQAKGIDSITPLHIAANKKFIRIAQDLLNYGAAVNYLCTANSWRIGYSPLHFAVEKCCKDLVTLLLKSGANVNIVGEDGITPLHIAVIKGYISIVEELVNFGACKQSVTLSEGYSPFHIACEQGNQKTVELLLNCGFDVNTATKDGVTPLHIATKAGNQALVTLLVARGANVDVQDKLGKTTLHVAVEIENYKIVKEILKNRPDVNNESNRKSVRRAVENNGSNNEKIVKALVNYGIIIHPDSVNYSTLHVAVEKGYFRIIEDLLKFGANVNMAHGWNREMRTPLHSAIINKQEDVVKLLLRYGADINAKDEHGKPPIVYAIEKNDVKLTELMLNNGVEAKNSPELLNIAVVMESLDIIELLLKYGADIKARDLYGRTCLHFTAMGENINVNRKGDLARFILSKGVDVNSTAGNGVTTLHIAVQKCFVKIVEVLLEHNANVNAVVQIGNVTPLHLSARRGNEKITQMLLNKGANIHAEKKNAITALHIAAHKCRKEIVKMLLKGGAKPDVKMVGNLTPLHLAARKGNQKVVKTILEFGADVGSKDDMGRTPLHLASEKGYNKVVKMLLDNGSDVNITTKSNHTALDRAISGSRFHYYSGSEGSYDSSDGYYGSRSSSTNVQTLQRHILKLKLANLHVSKRNLSAFDKSGEIVDFQEDCQVEIALMMTDKINNTNITYYNILAMEPNALARSLGNETIVQGLATKEYKSKYANYGGLIESNVKRGMLRKELLEGANDVGLILNGLFMFPYECLEKIFGYLSNEDLKNFIDACK